MRNVWRKKSQKLGSARRAMWQKVSSDTYACGFVRQAFFFLGLIWCLVRVCWCCWFCTLHRVVLMNLKFSEVYTLLRNSLWQRKREMYSCTSNSWDKNNESLWVQWYKYFHEVKDEMFHSMRRSQVEWYISSFCKIALCGMACGGLPRSHHFFE